MWSKDYDFRIQLLMYSTYNLWSTHEDRLASVLTTIQQPTFPRGQNPLRDWDLTYCTWLHCHFLCTELQGAEPQTPWLAITNRQPIQCGRGVNQGVWRGGTFPKVRVPSRSCSAKNVIDLSHESYFWVACMIRMIDSQYYGGSLLC